MLGGHRKKNMKKLNYVINDNSRMYHSYGKKRYITFDEFLDIIYVRGHELADLNDPNVGLHQDINILVDDPYATKDEIEKEVLNILKNADEYTTKRYAETYYDDYATLDCEVGDAFEYEDNIDEFVLDDESWERAEVGDIKSFEIRRARLSLTIYNRLKKDYETGELIDAYETTIDDEIIYKETTTQYIDIYYYANVEEVSENDLIIND